MVHKDRLEPWNEEMFDYERDLANTHHLYAVTAVHRQEDSNY